MFQYAIFGTMYKWKREQKKQVKKCVAPLEPPPDKTGYFSVRGATQIDARG
jgi:hypothetical protein